MKYTIESTEEGCIEILEFKDGNKFKSKMVRTCFGYETTGPCLASQLEDAGICEEIVEKVEDLFNGIRASDFIELAELER